MSDRLARSTRDISQYHISLEDAHTVLAQACLGVLLRDRDVKHDADSGPLARYAAKHWVTHAQFKNVASRVRDGMEYLFDPDKPYFEAWVQLHDVEDNDVPNVPSLVPGARPLYYAAFCGFHELVEHLIFKYPQYASAQGGRLGTVLHSASFAGHLQIVRSLLLHGVGVDVRGILDSTSLHCASSSGRGDVVRCLLDHGADVDSHNSEHNTPLNLASFHGHVNVVRVLLEHNADVHSEDKMGETPLHDAVRCSRSPSDYPQIVRLLLEHGANTNARDNKHRIPLHIVSKEGSLDVQLKVARILLEHGADVDAEDGEGSTPSQAAMRRGKGEIARLISEFRSGRAQM